MPHSTTIGNTTWPALCRARLTHFTPLEDDRFLPPMPLGNRVRSSKAKDSTSEGRETRTVPSANFNGHIGRAANMAGDRGSRESLPGKNNPNSSKSCYMDAMDKRSHYLIGINLTGSHALRAPPREPSRKWSTVKMLLYPTHGILVGDHSTNGDRFGGSTRQSVCKCSQAHARNFPKHGKGLRQRW